MKIAVVGPSPVPFVYGGAEKHIFDLVAKINSNTNHQCEIIKVPVDEFSFWALIESYHKFYTLDLSQFDMVITCKYPAWMVQHPNSVCWLLHTLRGLYDTYHMMGLPYEVDRDNEEINKVIDYMKENPEPENLDEYFEMLLALKDKDIDQKYFAFPGPMIRLVLHYMDHFALSKQQRLYTLSTVVKEREDYFPEGREVHAVYPPVEFTNLKTEGSEFFFVCSRLDGPKRMDLLIEAYKKTKTSTKLYIGGMGPERDKLQALADGDDRIKLLGFLSDEEKEYYYANCIAVPFIPLDEDYGYITVEAMMHKKPVITLEDAGGPTEFVRDGVTGYIATAETLAEKIDFYANHIDLAKLHGENAYEVVNKITWPRCLNMILNPECTEFDDIEELKKAEEEAQQVKGDRKKVVLTSTFTVFPPQGGGQARTFYLYKNLAKEMDVEIVAYSTVNDKAMRSNVAPGMYETRVPKTTLHQDAEAEIEKALKIPCTDIAMLHLSGLTPDWGKEFARASANADLVIFSHPYLYVEAKKYMKPGQKFAYEAQDVEYQIKRGMLPESDVASELLTELFKVEKEVCEKAEFIMTCSEDDADSLAKLYEIDRSKIIAVPNGVACDETIYTPLSERIENRKALGLEKEKMCIFMGSWHGPNLESCEKIFEIAPQCPDTKFFLMGSQCWYFRDKQIPANVGMLGLVSDEEKNRIFSTVDFALNPMLSGSGTNLKMFDYMAAGIPVITTEFGSRGIDDKTLYTIAEIDEMPKVINEFELKTKASQLEDARKYIEDVFDWGVITKIMLKKIEETLE